MCVCWLNLSSDQYFKCAVDATTFTGKYLIKQHVANIVMFTKKKSIYFFPREKGREYICRR